MSETLSQRILRRAETLKIDTPISVFFTLPAFISLFFLLAGFALAALDGWLVDHGYGGWWWLPGTDRAVTVFQVVAGSAMTALTLIYSLTLLTFTLAAGNIGPRLLQRFTSDLTIQTTAGIFGGTFLFAINAIFASGDGPVLPLTATVAFLLAIVMVAQLVWFVRVVATNVNIDEEIAQIGRTLETDIDRLVAHSGADRFDRDEGGTILAADRDGYVGTVQVETMAGLAREHGLHVELMVRIGLFLLRETPLLRVSGGQDLDEDTRHALLGAVSITPARAHGQTADFSINLLLEIALRALSPGVNDTFTAITCLDRLVAGLRAPVARNIDARFFCDDEGAARVFVPGLTAQDMIRSVFAPLRNVVGRNLLMAERMVLAIDRLYQVADPELHPALRREADLLLQTLRANGMHDDEAARIEELIRQIFNDEVIRR